MPKLPIDKYIYEGLKNTLATFENKEELKYSCSKPISVPGGSFPFYCYWDTYFTNLGLIATGQLEQAKNNVENFAEVVLNFGYIPNAGVEGLLNRSQPPLYIFMVNDYYNATKDTVWLKEQITAVEAEYSFWATKRTTPIGLNRYYHCATDEYLISFGKYSVDRIGIKDFDGGDYLNFGINMLSEAESGWDFNPRFGFECASYAPIDLNCILYGNEMMISNFHMIAGNALAAEKYKKLAQTRKELIEKYCFDEQKGQYVDYNFVSGKRSEILSCASILPYLVGLCDDKKMLLHLVDLLECEHGIAACVENDFPYVLQWDYPNMWANLIYFTIEALNKLSLFDRAKVIKNKFKKTVEREYERTENIWEKYDAKLGEVTKHNEYPMTDMMGWTAGVYAFYSSEK